ncbi:uncharacterized membrane protein (UPF0136 family) [Haloferula luteola]|uniref:Uncharacterized membrane protein (UPF0136 family) n=1 Tax=Haloferula luteola TaxID=595692 RepID=A0A840V2K4_9BACT|nr:uncharacterized membrane protein (UPF0136 family) [Haloferula luteola]
MKRGIGLVALIGQSMAQEGGDIRGPKPIVEIPVPEEPTSIGWVIAIALGLLLLTAGIVGWLRRKKGVVLSAEEQANGELDRLGREGGRMAAGVFAEAASGVLRRFIESRFGIAAPKRTTEEFLREVAGNSDGLGERVEGLRRFLRACDRAKFAGEEIAEKDREALLMQARSFVRERVEERKAQV